MYPTFLLGLAITVAAPAPKEGAKTDPTTALEGDWKVETYLRGGMAMERWTRTVFQIVDGKIVTLGKNEHFNYKLNSKADPPEIDMTIEKERWRGIYKYDGETLTLCFPADRGDRPTKFESPADSTIILMTLKREKKK